MREQQSASVVSAEESDFSKGVLPLLDIFMMVNDNKPETVLMFAYHLN